MPTPAIPTGLEATVTRQVGEHDTAEVVGSGDLPVLATPRLLAWLEAATCAALVGHVPPGATSVGTRIGLEHLAPSPVGALVTATALVTRVDGGRVWFEVTAMHDDGAVVARGEVTRVVVDGARFLERSSSG
ncbi:MAG: thioesterase family protein [Nocardioidaceae bacterium]